jgi:hypothetical protein
MRPGPAVLLAVLAALLAVPPAASAAIVPQEGIRGVKLDMPVAEVRATLGRPTRFRTVRNEILGKVREWRYGLTVVTFNSTAADATVVSIDTRSRAERTAAGIGVGSTRAAVRGKVPDTRCLVEFSYDHCFVGAWRPGQVVTDFAIDRRGRVSRVVVGRVLD